MALVISNVDYENKTVTLNHDPSVPEPPPFDESQAVSRMWLPELQAWCYQMPSQAILSNLDLPEEFIKEKQWHRI